MKHVVTIRTGQDDNTGEWGLLPDVPEFNAFWTPQGIFHDVFEHYHEGDKFFDRKHYGNIGGELAATGHILYYVFKMGLSERNFKKRARWMEYSDLISDTLGQYETEIDGEPRFNGLTCGVPYQRPVNDLTNDFIYAYMDAVKKAKTSKYYCKQVRDIKRNDVTRLIRYGYKKAEKLVPHNNENYETLTQFIAFWDDLTTRYNGEEFANLVHEVTFTVTKKNGIIKIKQEFQGYNTKVKIPIYNRFCEEGLYIFEEEY